MKKEKKKLVLSKKGIIIVSSVALAFSMTLGTIALAAANDWSFPKANDVSSNNGDNYPSYVVNDYTDKNPNITDDVAKLDEMKLSSKEWFEYVDYVYYNKESDGDLVYKIYTPVDYGTSSIMAVRDYNPDTVSGNSQTVKITDADWVPMFGSISAANTAVIAGGGVTTGVLGMVAQNLTSLGAKNAFKDNDDVLKNIPYYSTPEFMGIAGTEWGGISEKGFYNANSISISMTASETLNVAKTNSTDSTYSVGGKSSAKIGGGKVLKLFVDSEASIESNASSSLKYGVSFQQGQSVNNGITVQRTFSARTDDEVKDVGWKLVEYVVRVPYKVEVVSAENEDEVIATSFVTQDLLSGVCRVFANGYIEHWNTGELVNYADFFEGFITADQLITEAKTKMGGQ